MFLRKLLHVDKIVKHALDAQFAARPCPWRVSVRRASVQGQSSGRRSSAPSRSLTAYDGPRFVCSDCAAAVETLRVRVKPPAASPSLPPHSAETSDTRTADPHLQHISQLPYAGFLPTTLWSNPISVREARLITNHS